MRTKLVIVIALCVASFAQVSTSNSPTNRRRGSAISPVHFGSSSYRLRDSAAGVVALNSRALTPGAIRTAKLSDVCSTRTPALRHVTPAEKRAVFKIYGIDCGKDCWKKYEVDHLISLEIGGSNAIENLWPEPYESPGAHQKDLLENKLHSLVCSGKVSLDVVQGEIADDWWEAYWKYVRKGDRVLGR